MKTCAECSKTNRPSARFCGNCGKQLQADPDGALHGEGDANGFSMQRGASTQQSGKGLAIGVWILIAVGVLALFYVSAEVRKVGSSSSGTTATIANSGGIAAQPHEQRSKSEIDFSKLGLRSKTVALKTLGKPLGVNKNGDDRYAWGSVSYDKGRLVGLEYTYSVRPTSVSEALSLVGLDETSDPTVRESGNYQWCAPFSAPLLSAGFEFENVLVEKDFSSIELTFKRRYN